MAEASRRRIEQALQAPVHTEIRPATLFYAAEDYHQKYYLRNSPVLMAELRALYPRDEDLVASTLAARVNGYLAGYGDQDQMASELASLALPSASWERLGRLLAPPRARLRPTGGSCSLAG